MYAYIAYIRIRIYVCVHRVMRHERTHMGHIRIYAIYAYVYTYIRVHRVMRRQLTWVPLQYFLRNYHTTTALFTQLPYYYSTFYATTILLQYHQKNTSKLPSPSTHSTPMQLITLHQIYNRTVNVSMQLPYYYSTFYATTILLQYHQQNTSKLPSSPIHRYLFLSFASAYSYSLAYSH